MAIVAILVATALLEEGGYDGAYAFEMALVHNRVALAIIFFVLGIVTSSNESAIKTTFRNSIDYFKNDHSNMLGWPVQIAAVILIFAITILVLHPEVLDKITSIKAWQVEADFAAVNSSSIKDAPIVDFKDERRKSNVGLWAGFSMTKLAGEPAETLTSGSSGGRLSLFKNGGGNQQLFQWSNALFDKQFKPLFSALACFDEAGFTMLAQNDERLASLVAQYANAVRMDRSRPTDIANTKNKMVRLHDLNVETLNNLVDKLKEYKRVAQDIQECKSEPPDKNGLFKEFDGLVCHDSVCPNNLTSADLWDPYVIAAVADLIAFVDDQRKAAAFLSEVATDILEPRQDCGADHCGRRAPGFFNLSYAIVLAQLNGGGPWPLDAALKHLDAAMEGLDEILWRTPHATEDCTGTGGGWCLQRRFLLRSEFIDLSLGLALFEHHALLGEKLKSQDLARWRAWLTQTQRILYEIKSIVAPAGALLDKDKAAAWRDAEAYIAEDILSVGDIEASAALDPLLLAQQNGQPSAEDCLVSRAAFAHLRRLDFDDIVKKVGPETKDLYAGYLGQIESRISGICGN